MMIKATITMINAYSGNPWPLNEKGWTIAKSPEPGRRFDKKKKTDGKRWVGMKESYKNAFQKMMAAVQEKKTAIKKMS